MPSIRHIFHIDLDREEVFRKISEKENIRKWWTDETVGSSESGGTLEFKFGDRGHIKVQVSELSSPDKVVWTCLDGHPEWLGTKISFQIEKNERENLTRINFIHSGWKKESDFMGVCSFSWAKYFMSLKKLCEEDVGEPFKAEIK